MLLMHIRLKGNFTAAYRDQLGMVSDHRAQRDDHWWEHN